MTLPCPFSERLTPPDEPVLFCSCCNRVADFDHLDIVEAEREALGLPFGTREVHLCDEHNEARRATWGDVDDIHATLVSLAIAAGVQPDQTNVHPDLLAVRIGAKLPYHKTYNPGGIR